VLAPQVNLFGEDWEDGRDRPGWQWKRLPVGQRLGASRIGASLYEVAPGQRTFPYHYEYGNEEWLIAVSGHPTLRTPDGERVLEPGDVVVFPEGPEGAHQVINRTEEPVRVLIMSTKNEPGVAVYPDSDKLGIFPGNREDRALFPRNAAVDYFEGEE
jgi:uncharacterized cupin superfamily protein